MRKQESCYDHCIHSHSIIYWDFEIEMIDNRMSLLRGFMSKFDFKFSFIMLYLIGSAGVLKYTIFRSSTQHVMH